MIPIATTLLNLRPCSAKTAQWGIDAWVLMPNHFDVLRKIRTRFPAMLYRIAVGKLGYSGAEVAMYFGMTNSCGIRIAASDTELPVEKFIKEL